MVFASPESSQFTAGEMAPFLEFLLQPQHLERVLHKANATVESLIIHTRVGFE